MSQIVSVPAPDLQQKLAADLCRVRETTLALYSLWPRTDWCVPWQSNVNPPIWELAHIGWFQELWCARGGSLKAPSLMPCADRHYDSSNVPHRARWHLDFPGWPTIESYLAQALERSLDCLQLGATDAYFFELALRHEAMHGEAMLMTLQTLGQPSCVAPPVHRLNAKARDIAFEGGAFEQGAQRDATRFVFDNEKWAYVKRVTPFAISNRVVTVGEFLAFIDAGGYRQDHWWSHEGVAWRKRVNATLPRDWKIESGRVLSRWCGEAIELAPDAPMMHVSLHEAEAYCAFAKRRLPTETEWEFAAATNAEFWRSTGQVWEWTATAFAPYPDFAADPYKDYSAPWFGNHQVIRGASFFTHATLRYPQFRNFYLPERNDVFVGFRTCAIA